MKNKEFFSKIASYIPDAELINKLWLRAIYYLGMRKLLSFSSPTTLNEKMQWMKIYDRDPIYTRLADKILVRDIVKERIGECYLIPEYLTGHDLENLTLDNLPNRPFIIKANHDCSGGLIVRDINQPLLNVKSVSIYPGKVESFSSVSQYNLAYIKYFLNERFSYNHYYLTKEWQYKDIVPGFIIEELLSNDDGKIPNDYKLHCINGIVEFIYVSNDREGENSRKIYYPDWTEAPFTWSKRGKEFKFVGSDVARPSNLKDMIEVAEKLSSGLGYVRVDLYSDGTSIFFGELTLHQGSGIEPILPVEYDILYGGKLGFK